MIYFNCVIAIIFAVQAPFWLWMGIKTKRADKWSYIFAAGICGIMIVVCCIDVRQIKIIERLECIEQNYYDYYCQ